MENFTVIWVADGEERPVIIKSVHPVAADKFSEAAMKFLEMEGFIEGTYNPYPDLLLIVVSSAGGVGSFRPLAPTEWRVEEVQKIKQRG